MIEYKTLIFVVAVLYSLPEKWRGVGTSLSFESIFRGARGISLHAAWHQLKDEYLLGRFSDEFYFDALYDQSNLGGILERALQSMLIRVDGSNFAYHLDRVTPDLMWDLIKQHGLSVGHINQVAQRLNTLLEEQAALATSPAAR